MALAIRQEENRINATIEANLQIRAAQFNKLDISGLDYLRFNGSAEDCYEFIEQITLIARSRGWPIEETGSSTNEFGGTVNDAAAAPWNTPNPEIAAKINRTALTQDEKTTIRRGLYHKQPWKVTNYPRVVEPTAGAGGAGLGGEATLDAASSANIDLDGVTVIPGRIVAGGDADAARSTRPTIRGRFAAADGTTTRQNQPVNDCKRSRKAVEAVFQRFTEQAQRWWLDMGADELPRTFFNHRYEGQREDVNGDYGLFAKMRTTFIHPQFQQMKYNELKTLRYENYPLSISTISGREEPRSIMTFNRWWKSALWISQTDFGNLLNQREEYNKRIPGNIVERLKEWIVYFNIDPTMEEYYKKAVNIQTQLTQQGILLAQIMPLTTSRTGIRQRQNIRGRPRIRRRGRYISNIECEYDNDENRFEELDNNECSQMQQEVNAIQSSTQGFVGNAATRTTKTGKTRTTFSGAIINKKDAECWNCGIKGHFAMECQKSKSNQRRPTTSMNRDNARTNKGRKRIQNQYNRNKYTQGQRDRFRKRIGINDIEYDDGYYNDEYDDYKHNDKYHNKNYEPIEVYNTEYYNDQEQSYDQYKDYTNKSYDQQDLNEQFDEIDIIDEYYDNRYNDNEYDEYDNEYDEYDDGYYDNY